jgi:hypothetical protein
MPPGVGPMYGAAGPPTTDGGAIAAMVCGIVGLLLCPPAAIVAIVLGFTAKGRITRSNGHLTGGGMATAGIVLGFVWVGLFVVWLLVLAAVR